MIELCCPIYKIAPLSAYNNHRCRCETCKAAKSNGDRVLLIAVDYLNSDENQGDN